MRPKKHETTGSADLFRARLDQIINMRHELVQLAGKIDWEFIDGEIAPLYSDSGRPGIATRFVIGLFLLKHISGLSDEGVCERWVYDVLPALHWRGVLPARVSARALGPEPLAQAPRRQAGTSPGRELAGGARERGAADEGFGAGHGRYHRAAQQILRQYERRGDAMRYLGANGKIGWKASPRFLTMLADAERDAQDELEDFP